MKMSGVMKHCEQCGGVLLRLPGEQKSDFEVRRFCDRSCAGIYREMQKPGAIPMAEKVARTKRMRRRGKSWREIGEHFGVGPTAPRKWLERAPPRQGRPQLSKNSYAVMKHMRAQGYTYEKIGEVLGKDPATIYRCINGRRETTRGEPMAKWAMMAI